MTTTETAEARALLPCPLCGTSHLRMVQVFRPASEGDFQWRVGHDPDKAGFSCFTSGPVRDTKEEAVTVWNTRPSLTPPVQGGEWNAAIEAAIGLFSIPNTLTFGPSGPRRVKSPEQKAIVAKLSTLLRSAIPDASPGSATPSAPTAERLRSAAQFLLDRLDSLEWMDDGYAEVQRDFFGHVEPAMEHLRAALAGGSHG